MTVEVGANKYNIPMLKMEDSTADLNISNGTCANICSRTWRPLGVEEVSWGEWTSRISGSVTTKKWKTSSRNFWAYCPKTVLVGTTGVAVPSEEDAGRESTKTSHELMVCKEMERRHSS